MTENKHDDLIGKTLGSFTILEEIGRGGMATVYSAMQHSMNRKVAVKVLPRHFLHDPGFLERFEREVEVISRLEHPHILPIYDYGEIDGVPFITMRFLGGGSMAQMVRRGVPQLKDIEKPFKQVAEALDYAHQLGIIHRDLKPGNIMLDEYGNAYLSDFGIARVMGSNLTGSAIIGTPAYMSPEQAHGTNIDARSDIYSLGIVLFELITGREPYQAETPMSLLLKQINEPLPPIGDFRANVPQLVQDVVSAATAKNPDDRYASATEFANAFGDALRGERSATTRIGKETKHDPERTMLEMPTPLRNEGGTVVPTRGTEGMSAVPIPKVNESQVPVPSQSASPWLALVIGLVVIAGAIFAGVYFFTDIFKPQESFVLPNDFQLVETDNYSIGIPENLLPAASDFIDESSANRMLHRWQEDESLYITVAMVNSSRVSQEAYFEEYYAPQIVDSENANETTYWEFIDESTAEDGTLRRSYRLDNGDLPNGQIDLFFLERNGFLVVVEMYTADSSANAATIAELQTILDSLQVKEDA